MHSFLLFLSAHLPPRTCRDCGNSFIPTRAVRNRCSGKSHDLLREFVNSIMNNLFMTLPRKGLPSADRASQISKCITRQGFGKCVCTLMGSANFLCDHFPVQHVLAEVMQLNRKVLSSWAKFVGVREFNATVINGIPKCVMCHVDLK